MAELEVKAYRFSISWSRILPLGSGKVNQAGPLCDSEVAVAAVALALAWPHFENDRKESTSIRS